MRKNVIYIAFSIIMFFILALFTIAIFGHSLVFRIDTDLDVNSGDMRRQTYICSILIKDNIHTTPFSQEVRRLGIPITKKPLWERESRKVRFKYCEHSKYSTAINICDLLVDRFDDYNISDEERFIILQDAYENLQAGNIEEIIKLFQTLIAENEKRVKNST